MFSSSSASSITPVETVVYTTLAALSSGAKLSPLSPPATAPPSPSCTPVELPRIGIGFVEEILEIILAYAMDFSDDEFFAQSHPPSRMPAYRPAILRVCKQWLRIGTPLLFRSVVLRTVRDVTGFIHALEHQSSTCPNYGTHVRKLLIREDAMSTAELVRFVLERTPNLVSITRLPPEPLR
jgi:hypothetical protein